MRILFYAINHVGLGHVVRLSILQRFTQRKAADCYFVSESRHAASFFSCPGVLVEGEGIRGSQRGRLLEAGLRRAIDEVRPDILVCDTYWSEAAASIPRLRRRGARAILMLRMTESRLMALRLRSALPAFDSILLPHHPDEIRWAYRNDPDLLRELDTPQVAVIAPVCRTAARPCTIGDIIFTVGAGGEWPDASKANTVRTFLGAYCGASRLLQNGGHAKPKLAAGAFVDLTEELNECFDVLRTTSLYEHFGPDTTVVSRGGYNTVWEAVAAGSRLVVCGTRRRLDDIKGRSAFIQRQGLGRSVRPDARALYDAIAAPWERQPAELRRWAGIVNGGLDLAFAELSGEGFLRAREPSIGYSPANMPRRRSKPTRLIARFEEVDALHPTSVLLTTARSAIKHGYDTQLCLQNAGDAKVSRRLLALEKDGAVLVPKSTAGSSHTYCVPVLAWPGPRVRNELRISEEIVEHQKRGVSSGLSIHADRVPLFLTEYLLRAFSLHNR